jgi:hypothetical protein
LIVKSLIGENPGNMEYLDGELLTPFSWQYLNWMVLNVGTVITRALASAEQAYYNIIASVQERVNGGPHNVPLPDIPDILKQICEGNYPNRAENSLPVAGHSRTTM